jgi:hypothetical protein
MSDRHVAPRLQAVIGRLWLRADELKNSVRVYVRSSDES